MGLGFSASPQKKKKRAELLPLRTKLKRAQGAFSGGGGSGLKGCSAGLWGSWRLGGLGSGV